MSEAITPAAKPAPKPKTLIDVLQTICPHCPPDSRRTTPAFAIGGLPRLENLPLSQPEAPVSTAAWLASCELVNGRVTLDQLRAALTLQCLSGDGVGTAETLHAFRLLTELEPLVL